MAFKGWHDMNPFVPVGVLALLLVALVYFWPRLFKGRGVSVGGYSVNLVGPTRDSVLKGLLFFTLIAWMLIMAFEVYFHVYRCSVSTAYYEANIRLAHHVINTFTALQVPYHLDYATLLNALRKEVINPWDHDTDFSIVNPGKEGITHLLAAFNHPQSGTHAFFEEERQLLQVRFARGNQGPHVDIWLWRDFVDQASGVRMLETADHTVAYNPRRFDEVFPVQPVSWAGITATIPADAHGISGKEFARFGGSYMVAAVFRGDCLHNTFSLRWLPW